MEVKGIAINWMLGWMNNPRLHLWVNAFPKNITMYPNRLGTANILWYGEDRGKVSFYSDATLRDSLQSRQEDGFGGRHIKIWTEEGVHTLKGPWSSRASVMNQHHQHAIDNHCVEVAITEEEDVFERGYTYFGSAVTVDFANKALKQAFNIQLSMEEDKTYYIDKSHYGEHGPKEIVISKDIQWKKKL